MFQNNVSKLLRLLFEFPVRKDVEIIPSSRAKLHAFRIFYYCSCTFNTGLVFEPLKLRNLIYNVRNLTSTDALNRVTDPLFSVFPLGFLAHIVLDYSLLKIKGVLNWVENAVIIKDENGTLIAYKGELGDYYCLAAKAVGLSCLDYKRMHEGFKIAYTNMAKQYPCFGHAAKMPNVQWWRKCVKYSFDKAGYSYDEETFERIFGRIYSSFGSSAPCTVFQDSVPFLRWARNKGFLVGSVGNSKYRYPDVILPALGMNKEFNSQFLK